MECVLIISLSCEVFKKNPIARVFLGDTFLDEFDIRQINAYEDNTPKTFYWVMIPEVNAVLHNIREYHVDLPFKDTELSIEIYNDDNNFSNGFMTKYTKVFLNYVYIFPKKLLKHHHRLGKNWRFNKISYDNLRSFKKHFKKRAYLFSNMIPGVKFVSKKNVHEQIRDLSLGESGVYKLRLYKKHGILWSNKVNGYVRCKHCDVFNFFINKYLQDENQRSGD